MKGMIKHMHTLQKEQKKVNTGMKQVIKDLSGEDQILKQQVTLLERQVTQTDMQPLTKDDGEYSDGQADGDDKQVVEKKDQIVDEQMAKDTEGHVQMINHLSEENKTLQDKIEALKAKIDKHELQKYVLSQSSTTSLKRQSSENRELKKQVTRLQSQISGKDLDEEFFKNENPDLNREKILEDI